MVAIQLPSAVEIILFLFKVTFMYPLFICTNLAPIASGDVFLTRTKRKNKTLISLRYREALCVSVILQQMETSEDPLISRFGEPIKMDQIQHLFTACFLQPYTFRDFREASEPDHFYFSLYLQYLLIMLTLYLYGSSRIQFLGAYGKIKINV